MSFIAHHYFPPLSSKYTFHCSIFPLIIVQTADSFLLNGFTTFIPKIFEVFFQVDSATAGIFAGMCEDIAEYIGLSQAAS
jgi:hypothetical protein